MPVGNVLIGDAGRDVKHDDATLALDVVAIAETTKLFLAGSIPNVENDCAKVGGEGQRVNLNSKCGCVIVAHCVSNKKKERDATGFLGHARMSDTHQCIFSQTLLSSGARKRK